MYGTFAPVRYLGFDLGIRYSQYFQIRKISWAFKTTIAPKQTGKQKFYPK